MNSSSVLHQKRWPSVHWRRQDKKKACTWQKYASNNLRMKNKKVNT